MLKLGTAAIEITPAFPVPLAGFASRSALGPASETSLPLRLRVLFLQSGGAKLILAIADLIWWGEDRVPGIKKTCRELWPDAELVLHATHTHSGPQTSFLFSDLLGKPDEDYLLELERRLIEAARISEANMEEVSLERGAGQCPIAISRRSVVDGVSAIGPNPAGTVDRELTALRFASARTGRIRAVLVHYACHPVVSADNVRSAEFVGAAMDLLERELGDGALCAYLQGACGDVNPDTADVQALFDGGAGRGAEAIARLGAVLAASVLSVLEREMKPLRPEPLRVRSIRVPLPLQRVPDLAELEKLRPEEDKLGAWSRALLRHPERLTDALPLELTLVELAEGLSLVAMNAEVVAAYGLYIKELTQGAALPLAYSNGMIGYLTTARQLEEGGYEPADSIFYFAMPAPFRADTEPLVRKHLKLLLGQS